jgi:hypothetical protein
MKTPHIVATEWFDQGILITFDDGTTALYSVNFLHEYRSAAEEVWDENDFKDLKEA